MELSPVPPQPVANIDWGRWQSAWKRVLFVLFRMGPALDSKRAALYEEHKSLGSPQYNTPEGRRQSEIFRDLVRRIPENKTYSPEYNPAFGPVIDRVGEKVRTTHEFIRQHQKKSAPRILSPRESPLDLNSGQCLGVPMVFKESNGKPALSNEQIRFLRTRPDFNKISDSVFVDGWWKTLKFWTDEKNKSHALVFGADPTDWTKNAWPRAPESIRCVHFVNETAWTACCKLCAGLVFTREPKQTIHRALPLRPEFAGNSSDTFNGEDIRFQPYILVRPDKGFGPDLGTEGLAEWALTRYDEKIETEQGRGYRKKVLSAKRGFDNSNDSSNVADLIRDSETTEFPVHGITAERWWPGGEISNHELLLRIVSEVESARQQLRGLAAHLKIGRSPLPAFSEPDAEYEKCSHGVMWGADNCRVCNPVVYSGKEFGLIWNAIATKQIERIYRGYYTGDRLPFVVVPIKGLGLSRFAENREHWQVLRDRMRAMKRSTCVVCGVDVERGLSFCRDCAVNEVMVVPQNAASVELFNTFGAGALYTESKARPLSSRMDFGTVKLFVRGAVCQALSEASDRVVDSVDDLTLQAVCSLSPQLMTLLRRFYLYHHNVPVADIAAMEELRPQSLITYFTRYKEAMQTAYQPLLS